MTEPIITASGLTKRFAPGAGVFDLTLDLDSGLIIGFIGPSGSGKTATVRLMTGILSADSGRLTVLGESPPHFKSQTRARIGYMPQKSLLYPDLTLAENLNFAASLYGMPYRRAEEMRRVIDFVELDGAVDRLPRDASGGEIRRVMLASTLVHRPDLLFLDEPTAGIDPVLRRKFWDRFRDLADEGRSLVVTTQYVGEAAYCDLVAVLSEGKVITVDTPDGLRRTAYGGELIEMVFTDSPDRAQLADLSQSIGGRQIAWLDDHSVRLVVEDAGKAIRRAVEWGGNGGAPLEQAETYLPPFDDVFVELMDKLEPVPSEGPNVD